MAPRASKSQFDARVTIYEPAAVDAPGSSSTPLKRARVTRSSTASSPVVKSLKEDDDSDLSSAEEEEEVKPSKVAKKATTPRKPKAFQTKLDKPHPEPKRWKEQLAVLQEQRKRVSLIRRGPQSRADCVAVDRGAC